MSALNHESTPRQAHKIVAQRAAGKWVLLDVKSGHYYALDGVGGRVWELCDGARSVRQIAEVVSNEYDTGGHEVEDDVVALISELAGESLLV
jgi:hypothetical protein